MTRHCTKGGKNQKWHKTFERYQSYQWPIKTKPKSQRGTVRFYTSSREVLIEQRPYTMMVKRYKNWKTWKDAVVMQIVNLSSYQLHYCFHPQGNFYACSSREVSKNSPRCCVYGSPSQGAKPMFNGRGLDEQALGIHAMESHTAGKNKKYLAIKTWTGKVSSRRLGRAKQRILREKKIYRETSGNAREWWTEVKTEGEGIP